MAVRIYKSGGYDQTRGINFAHSAREALADLNDFSVLYSNVGKVRLPDGRYFDTGLPRGFPDLTCVIRGRAVFIEVKAPGGRVSPEQEKIHRILRNHGAYVAVCYSVEDAEKFILNEVLQNET